MSDKKNFLARIQGTWLLSLLMGLIAFFLYEMTNAKGLYWGDPGEFLSAAQNLGIGHAYGHPFFWLLGRLSILLHPDHPAAAMNHLVALFSAFSVAAASLLTMQSCRNIKSAQARFWIVASVTLFYMTISTIWAQATFIEVYNIQAFFLILAIWALNRYLFENNDSRYLYLFAFLWGVSVTLGLYLALLIILPAAYFWSYRRKHVFTVSHIFIASLFGILGLSIWIYLPVRSSLQPDFFRENINSLGVFLEYLGRKDFLRNWIDNHLMMQYVMKTSLEIFIKNLGLFGAGTLILFLIRFFKKSEEDVLPLSYVITVLLLLIVFTLLLPLNLILIQLIDMDVYFIPIYILLIPLFAAGLGSVRKFLQTRWAFVILLPVLIPAVLSYSKIDKSGHHLTEDFKKYLVENMPDSVTVVAASDAVFHQIFTSVFVEGNPKNFKIDDKGLKTTYDHFVQLKDSSGIIYEIDRQFIDAADDLTQYVLGGIFLLFPEDSLTAQQLEQGFLEQFSFDEEKRNALSREDRINFGLLFMNRAAYWWEIWKAQPMPRDNGRAKEAVKEALLAYHMTAFLDDFSYIGAYASGQIAMIYTLYNQLDLAEEYAKKALEIHPLTASAFRTLVLVERRRNRFESAMKYMQKLMAVSQDKERILIDKAFLYLHFGREEDALACYREALKNGAKHHPDLDKLENR